MSNWSMDEDTAILIAAGLLAAACLALAVRSFRQGRTGLGVLALVGALLFGFVCLFFATFTMRMF